MRSFKKITAFLIVCLVCSHSMAQTNKNDRRVVVEEIVAVVGDESISMSELNAATKYIQKQRSETGFESDQHASEEALETLMLMKLMVGRARLDSLDKDMQPADERVQRRIDEMINEVGSMKELENKTSKPIFKLREDLKKEIEESDLAEIMQYEITGKVTVTHPEVIEFYRSILEDDLETTAPLVSYSQIVKMPPSTEERNYEVRQKLLELRERILNGEKMSVLARLYSQDGSRYAGGEYKGMYDATVAPYAEAVRSMKPGQISEIVETEYGFHLIELISKTEHDFVSRHILMKPEFTLEEEAKAAKELDSIANELRSDRISFQLAALRFSDDKETKMNGGLNFNTIGFLMTGRVKEASIYYNFDQLNPNDSKVLSKMNEGEISDAYQSYDNKRNIVYKIIKVERIIAAHKINLMEDYEVIESYALMKKRSMELDNWVDKVIGDTYIKINPDYNHYNFDKKGWRKQSDKQK